MKLLTPVERPARRPCIDYPHRLMLLGSCFATHIGARLQESRFRCDVNPYGVLYNPLSISTALREMLAGKVYTPDDLYEHLGLWHSPMHHGDFSAASAGDALRKINLRLEQAARQSGDGARGGQLPQASGGMLPPAPAIGGGNRGRHGIPPVRDAGPQ